MKDQINIKDRLITPTYVERLSKQMSAMDRLITPTYVERLSKQMSVMDRLITPTYVERLSKQMSAMDRLITPTYMKRLSKQMNTSISNILEDQNEILYRMTNIKSKLLANIGLSEKKFTSLTKNTSVLSSNIRNIVTSLEKTKIYSVLNDITLDDIRKLDQDFYVTDGTVAHTEGKEYEPNHQEITEYEVKQLIDDAIEKNKEEDKSSLLVNLFQELVKSFIYNEMLSAGLVIIQILISVICGFAQGNYDLEIKERAQNVIKDTKYQKAYSKIFINEKIESPFSKLGFLRTSSLLRAGPKKTAPISEKVIISQETVVTMLIKKGNWAKIQVDENGNSYIGWVEESKVIKFKVISNK